MSAPRPLLPPAWAVLAALLVVTFILFGNSADYPPELHDGLVTLLLLSGAAAAWRAGGRAVVHGDPPRRLLAAAALLLVAPFILFGVLLGIGPPHEQPPRENDLRFLVLAIDSMLVGAGFFVLKESLADAGERLHATLGGAMAWLACPLYVAFALIQRNDYVAEQLRWSWTASVSGTLRELTPLDAFSMSALFFAGMLTYLATLFFARSLGVLGWLGPRTARAFQAVAVAALLLLVLRGFAYPSMQAAFSHWFTVPGFVVGIPAVPWIMPCVVGVMMLRRCAREDALAMPAAAPVRPAASSSAP